MIILAGDGADRMLAAIAATLDAGGSVSAGAATYLAVKLGPIRERPALAHRSCLRAPANEDAAMPALKQVMRGVLQKLRK